MTRSAALLADVKARIPPLESAQRASMYGAAVLLGQSPGDLVAELSIPAAPPPVPTQVPIGLPSDLLRRRPDVRRAERQLAAETARVGVAKSDWFPKLSLTGDVGQEGVTVANWFDPGSRFWSIGPSLEWKALDFGRVRAEVRAQTAVQEAALATYQKAVLVALQETEIAIVAYAQEQIRHRALLDSVAQNRQSLELADNLYQYGRSNFLDVPGCAPLAVSGGGRIGAQRSGHIGGTVPLYKALGGGWETLQQAPVTATDARR